MSGLTININSRNGIDFFVFKEKIDEMVKIIKQEIEKQKAEFVENK